jgi:hypothetical protein
MRWLVIVRRRHVRAAKLAEKSSSQGRCLFKQETIFRRGRKFNRTGLWRNLATAEALRCRGADAGQTCCRSSGAACARDMHSSSRLASSRT